MPEREFTETKIIDTRLTVNHIQVGFKEEPVKTNNGFIYYNVELLSPPSDSTNCMLVMKEVNVEDSQLITQETSDVDEPEYLDIDEDITNPEELIQAVLEYITMTKRLSVDSEPNFQAEDALDELVLRMKFRKPVDGANATKPIATPRNGVSTLKETPQIMSVINGCTIMSKLQTSNSIIRRHTTNIISWGFSKPNAEDKKIYTLMEDGGTNLYDALRQWDISMSEKVDIIKQIGNVIQEINNEGYSFIDIKPENILLSFNDEFLDIGKYIVKLTDFDSLRKHQTKGDIKTHINIADHYTELFAPKEVAQDHVAIKNVTDLYPFALVVFAMLQDMVMQDELTYRLLLSCLNQDYTQRKVSINVLTSFIEHRLARVEL